MKENVVSRIGVVTVTYNSASVLDDFLASVRKQSYPDFLLYIIDSGSTDNSVAKLAEISDPCVRIVASATNIGFAAGCNVGIKMAIEDGCDSVMLLNNDTVFEGDLFQRLLDGLEEHHCDMTSPKMLYFDAPNKIWAAGGHLNKWLGYRNSHDGANQLDDGRFDRARRVSFTPFCCVLIRSSVIQTLGYLDEKYFVYTEDADYCFRALRANLSLWYLPESKLLHKVSSLTGHLSDFMVRYCTRNRSYFLYKHFSTGYANLWNALYWIYQCSRYGIGKDSSAIWRLKYDAMREGLELYKSPPAS